MTQPIDVAYVEVRADLDGFAPSLKREVDKAFKGVESSSKDLSSSIENDFDGISKKIETTFRDAKGKLRDATTGRSIKDGIEGFTELGAAAGAAGAKATSAFGGVAGSLAGMGGPLKIAAVAFLLMGAAAVVASIGVQAVIIAGAGLATLPGLIFGAVSAFGVLKVATSGIGEAFKELTTAQKAAGGGGTAKQQEASQRALADSLRGVTEAQNDLSKARRDATRDIDRLTVAVARARAVELRSANDLTKAEKLLEDTRKVGTAEQITEATIAYEEAKAAADDAALSAKELAQDKARADKAGIEGSDRVVAALERLRDAQDRVVMSQAALAAGGAALGSQTPAFDGLTRSAQRFVLALVQAKKDLTPLADRIQEIFFLGSDKLLPEITKNINDLSGPILTLTGTLNGLFAGLLRFLGSPEFKDAASGALKGFSDFLKATGPGLGNLLKAFTSLAGQFGKVGKDGRTLGERLGASLGKIFDKIADFVANVDLEKLFDDAGKALATLEPLVQPTINLVKELFVLFKTEGPTIIKIVAASINILAFSVFYANEQFKFLIGTLRIIKSGIEDFGDKVREIANNSAIQVAKLVASIKTVPDQIAALGSRMFNSGKKIITSFFDGLGTTGGFIANFGKKLANGFIQAINNSVIAGLNSGIKKVQDSLNAIPGVNLSLFKFDKIPALAGGGVALGDTLARIGEQGRKEAVLPLENPRAMAAIASAIAKAGKPDDGGNGVVFSAGSIVMEFHGAAPSEAEAFRAGQAVGSGIENVMRRKNIHTQIRTLGIRHG